MSFTINALVVADGIFSFKPDPVDAYFTLNKFIGELSSSLSPKIAITTAQRRYTDRNTDIAELFNFAQHDLSQYDQIWLFGYEGSNDGYIESDFAPLSSSELVAIANFMQAGGGVFATGDHSGLGSYLCGQIPRVRSMRKWYGFADRPPGYPENAPGISLDQGSSLPRLDTLQPDHNGQWWFDNQSDDIPQTLKLPNGMLTAHPVL